MRALSHSAALLDVVRPEGKGRVLVPRWVLAGVLAVAAGCSAPDADPLGTSRQELFANDKTAYEYFLGKGLTNFQAAGVVGNLDQESGVDPAIHQNNGGVGRGIAQWSTGGRWDTTNNDNVLQYATAHGQSPTSLGLQLDFMWYELTTFPEFGLAQLKASTNITDATTAVEDKYEGCVYANFPECALPSRINFAKGIFNAYGAETSQGGQGGGGAGGAGAGAGGASGAAGAAGSGGSGGTSISGSAGSDGATVGGSSGSSSAGVSGSAPSNAGSSGSPSGAGGTSIAGTTSAGGSPGAAGSFSVAGSPGAASSTTFPGPSSATNDSGCAFSRPSKTR